MNVDKLNKWLALIANVGVLIGILFLILELQQSNRIALVSTEIETRNNFAALNDLMITNRYLTGLVEEARESDAEFTPEERSVLAQYAARNLQGWRNVVTSYDYGLVNEVSYLATFDDIRRLIRGFPGMHSIWQTVIDAYPSRAKSPIFVTIQEELRAIK